ncbi:MAG TPA: hypothetical protein VFY06_11395 [Verrucomicrobiae bacterium]|nr:hypothetical protein [Verrucomicrobiae bacterium]
MRSHIKLADCLWLQGIVARFPLFLPITKGLEARGVRPLILPARSDRAGWRALKDRIWKTDQHVMLHGLRADELRHLYAIFKERRNFSVFLVDWWTSPFWFTQNAEYALFHLYNGIATRAKGTPFCNGWEPPMLSMAEQLVSFQVACAGLRPTALLAQPFCDWRDQRWRSRDVVDPDRLIYFPIPVIAENLPFREESPKYDICSIATTCGFWFMRDAYAPAKYNFVNLYLDRKRLLDLAQKFEGRPYSFFDRRRHRGGFSWEAYCQSLRQSRFAISTGGIHEASVPKYMEYICLGTPLIGSKLPFEFPWADQCLYPIDGLHVTPEELKVKLKEAFELQPKLRQNCLNLRDTLLRMYDPVRLFDMAQDQIDGKPVPPGYLR